MKLITKDFIPLGNRQLCFSLTTLFLNYQASNHPPLLWRDDSTAPPSQVRSSSHLHSCKTPLSAVSQGWITLCGKPSSRGSVPSISLGLDPPWQQRLKTLATTHNITLITAVTHSFITKKYIHVLETSFLFCTSFINIIKKSLCEYY